VKDYEGDKIRNLALVSHGGAGKTTLTESILFTSGTIQRQGRVADGSTVSDSTPEEIKRKISLTLSLAHVEWGGAKVNLIDTPGYFDFFGEVTAALAVADAALIAVNAQTGVEAGTERIWTPSPAEASRDRVRHDDGQGGRPISRSRSRACA